MQMYLLLLRNVQSNFAQTNNYQVSSYQHLGNKILTESFTVILGAGRTKKEKVDKEKEEEERTADALGALIWG